MRAYRLELSDDERKQLKIWAARADKTVKQFLLDAASEKADKEKLKDTPKK